MDTWKRRFLLETLYTYFLGVNKKKLKTVLVRLLDTIWFGVVPCVVVCFWLKSRRDGAWMRWRDGEPCRPMAWAQQERARACCKLHRCAFLLGHRSFGTARSMEKPICVKPAGSPLYMACGPTDTHIDDTGSLWRGTKNDEAERHVDESSEEEESPNLSIGSLDTSIVLASIVLASAMQAPESSKDLLNLEEPRDPLVGDLVAKEKTWSVGLRMRHLQIPNSVLHTGVAGCKFQFSSFHRFRHEGLSPHEWATTKWLWVGPS